MLEIDWSSRQPQVTIHEAATGTAVLSTPKLSFDRDPLTADELAQVPAVMDGHLISGVGGNIGSDGNTATWRIRRRADESSSSKEKRS